MSRWGKKRGRPPRDGVAASHSITIRLTPDEYFAWTGESVGQPLSNFVRRIMNKAVADMNPPRRKATP